MQIDLARYKNIVVLTGAGISVASGLRTYRGPDGIWDELSVETYGTLDTLYRDPQKTWQVFGRMRVPLREAKPNPAHLALALLERQLRPDQRFLLVTQNIDGLHRDAGSQKLIELHGNVRYTRCRNEACTLERFFDDNPHSDSVPDCPLCGDVLRPDIVLFGEMIPPLISWEPKRALRDCDLFIAIGTSGTVSPAANFVRSAEYVGARTIYVNLEPMQPKNPAFGEEYLGKAEELLPEIFGVSLQKMK